MVGSSSNGESSDYKTLTDHSSQRSDLMIMQPLPYMRKAEIDASLDIAWNDQGHVYDLENESLMINMLQMSAHGNTKTRSKNKINGIHSPEENNKPNKSESLHTL